MTEPLHIVRLVLDRRQLARLARRHHLGRGVDEGYLLHAGLAQLFATSTEPARVPLHTFAIDDTLKQAQEQPESVFLLAYSDVNEQALVKRMGPWRRTLVRACETNSIPEIPAGTQVAFRARVCPIVRTRLPVAGEPGNDTGSRKKTREVDAWLASETFQRAADKAAAGEALPFEHSARVWSGREEVYGKWLKKELGRDGAAVLDDYPRLASFERDRLYRRNSRSSRLFERPNAVMEGLLRVEDKKAFRTILRRGLGRHRAFGFGMLLLRSPGA